MLWMVLKRILPTRIAYKFPMYFCVVNANCNLINSSWLWKHKVEFLEVLKKDENLCNVPM